MILNGGLGASTKTGIEWELQTSFASLFMGAYTVCPKKFELIDTEGVCQRVFYLPKTKLYSYLSRVHQINWQNFISRKILGDEVIVNEHTKSVYVFEKKSQKCAGSVDEKIQTCDFKRRQLQKLLTPIGYTAHYIYLLNSWFEQPQYQDAIDYIRDVGCEVYFNTVPKSRMQQILGTEITLTN